MYEGSMVIMKRIPIILDFAEANY